MEIYWDQIFFSDCRTTEPVVANVVDPVAADLHYRGFSRSYRKGGRYGPHWFDYSDVSSGPRMARSDRRLYEVWRCVTAS